MNTLGGDITSVNVQRQNSNELFKPLVEARNIIACLLPSAECIKHHASGSQPLDLVTSTGTNNVEKKVVILTRGTINFIRESAGGIHFGTAQAPAIIGLIGSPLRINGFKLVAEERSEIYSLPRESAIALIDEHGLLLDALNYCAYITDVEYKYSDRLINKTSYEMVCSLLQELALYPEEKRLKISVAQFIIDRTHMGRSGMMRILSELRKGGYVNIVYGRLMSLGKPFPKVF